MCLVMLLDTFVEWVMSGLAMVVIVMVIEFKPSLASQSRLNSEQFFQI